MRFLLFILFCCLTLYFPTVAYSSEEKISSNYCKDQESWEQYHELLAKYPDDEQIYSLYAMRIGLCSMVEAKTISQNRAVDIFERMRAALLRYYKEDEELEKFKEGT